MRVTTAVMVLALSLATGCSGAAPNGAPTVVAPTGTGPVSLPDRPAAITAVEVSSTAPAATEGSVPATAGATHLSPGGPWRLVASAPGIQSPGLVYELMPRLWVFLPSEQDLAHGVVWTFHERDREVIEDWLRAMVVYYRGVTVDPMQIGRAHV